MDFEYYLRAEEARKRKLIRARKRRERIKRRRKVVSVLSFALIAVLLVGGYTTLKPEEKAPQDEISAPQPVSFAQEKPSARIVLEPIEVEEDYYRGDIPLDRETQKLLKSACDEAGIEYELALAVIYQETRFQNIMGDNGNSYGYMQIQPRWHSDRMERLGVTDLNDPLSNFRVGCDLLAELLERYTLEEALTAYNTGSAGTSKYATSVIGYMEEYKTRV